MSFENKLAVVTGGGDGMGRSLAVQLAAEGCHVAMCDISPTGMADTLVAATAAASGDVRITTHVCDVSDEASLIAFRDAVLAEHQTDTVDLLFNNAGIGGGGSFVLDERDAWERTFSICWSGVYLGCRTFLPALMKSDGGHIVNTSSVNGFWASLGPTHPHTAYSAAKFAVKGFTEALIQDLALNAPNLSAHVVMPGHIGTGIAINSAAVHGADLADDPELVERGNSFRNEAPMTADQAGNVILDGVREGRWRILVGEDAHVLDMLVRDRPEKAYDDDFLAVMADQDVMKSLVEIAADDEAAERG